MTEHGSKWFRRLIKQCRNISPNIQFKRIKHGFYRIYWNGAYVHEVYKEMPQFGHDIEEADMRLESKDYYEQFEDRAELTRKIKNFREGYWDALDTIQTRVWLMRHNNEHYQNAVQAYKQHVIK